MHWVRFQTDRGDRFGLAEGDEWVVETDSSFSDLCRGEPPVRGARRRPADLELLAPAPRPGKIIAIGQNYMDHCREQGLEPPPLPIIFAKFTSSLNHPGSPICWDPRLTSKVDFEAELAVVIGTEAKRVRSADALKHVLGYTAANDVSARDLQFTDKQWVRGKSLDTFCPLGPVLVTSDEIPDPQSLAVRSEVNGRLMQDGHTGEMIFSVAELISYASFAFTLEPGDVILTGTPDGVGFFRHPPVFLTEGDLVTIEIEGIGRLENPCRFDRVEDGPTNEDD